MPGSAVQRDEADAMTWKKVAYLLALAAITFVIFADVSSSSTWMRLVGIDIDI
jgi:hypothetical protein